MQEASAKVLLKSWVKKQVQRSGWKMSCQGEGKTLQTAHKWHRTGEERAWRCFEQKALERVMAAVLWIDWSLTCFMVKAQGNIGLRKVLLSCIHSGGFDFLVKGLQRPFKWQFGDMYNYYSPCTIPPSKLSKKYCWLKVHMKFLWNICRGNVFSSWEWIEIFFITKWKAFRFGSYLLGLGIFFFFLLLPITFLGFFWLWVSK